MEPKGPRSSLLQLSTLYTEEETVWETEASGMRWYIERYD